MSAPPINASRKTGTRSLAWRLRKLGYKSYGEYLASSHWRDLRKRWHVTHAGARCACGRRGKSLHHTTYVRLGHERLSDLELVCDDCHRERHGIPQQAGRPKRKASSNVTYRRTTPDPRPRDWSYDRDLKGKFVAPPHRATTVAKGN